MVWPAGLAPATSCFQGRRSSLAELRPELVGAAGIEPAPNGYLPSTRLIRPPGAPTLAPNFCCHPEDTPPYQQEAVSTLTFSRDFSVPPSPNPGAGAYFSDSVTRPGFSRNYVQGGVDFFAETGLVCVESIWGCRFHGSEAALVRVPRGRCRL